MAINVGNDWQEIFDVEAKKEYYIKLREKLVQEYTHNTVYPDKEDIFNAFKYCSLADTKVCIIGQDPYHDVNQAHGLAFSVKEGVELPPSLINIYKELSEDMGAPMKTSGCLDSWAKQGVLLLNAVLTVRAHQAASHKSLGWEQFTDNAIMKLNEREKPVVFILWGNFARKKAELITNSRHYIIESAHPSPLSASRGFFGSKPFSKTNKFLLKNNIIPIKW
ncbi:MAG: uracil-DNA glycosylase [Clostridia bacterium]|nr:uracil-DNA glycosylase [Clostridia bacterium]